MAATVLHVVESYGAGTATALDQYVRATPDLDHHLIRRYRPDDDHADDGEQRRFASVSDLGSGVVQAVRSVRARVRELRPDIVHGHSSYGGAFARLGTPRSSGGPLVVYTPHCFAMERQDLSAPARSAFGLVERMLARRTDVYAGCSPREVSLARELAPRSRHQWVVNVAPDDLAGVALLGGDGTPSLVAMGRLTEQRDPALFAAVVGAVRAEVGDVDARWVGGGDAATISFLQAAGIDVTGWLPRSEALARAAQASVYLHTAAWDGAPMTLIEAQALGLPLVARHTPAVAEPAAWTATSAADLAALAVRVLRSPSEAADNRAAWAATFAEHTGGRQRADLLAAYGLSGRVAA